MTDDNEKNETSDLLGAGGAETLHEEKAVNAPPTNAEIHEAVEDAVNAPTPLLNPRA
jgi:hypothetical protein